jgi:hypothetical protein
MPRPAASPPPDSSPGIGAVERLGALDVGAGKSGDLVPAVLVRQLDENLDVAVDNLIGTGGTKESSRNLKPLNRRELVLAANRLACFPQQQRSLRRVLGEGSVARNEHGQQRER